MPSRLRSGFFYAVASLPLMLAGIVGPDVFHLSAQLKELIFFASMALAFVCVFVGATKEIYEESSGTLSEGHRKRMIGICGMALCGLGFIGFACVYFLPNDSNAVTAAEVSLSPTAKLTIVEERNSALKSLQSIFGQEEMSLRSLFDIQRVLERNIAIQKARIGLRLAGRPDDFNYNDNAEGDGSFIWLAKEGKYHFLPSGGPRVDAGPRDVLFLITTKKYQDSAKTLSETINSAILPQTVKDGLVDFKAIVDKDMEIMVRLLDERMNTSDEYFLKYDQGGTDYYKEINNEYVKRFVALKPKADAIIDAIRNYWKGG